jgi:hypothetical protein
MPCPATKRAAVLLIETDSISVIGSTAEAIAPHMDPGRNISHSFRVFWQGIERVLGEAEVQT